MNQMIITAVTLVTIVGLIVLIALGKVSWGDAGPLIAALAGVHGGASLASTLSK